MVTLILLNLLALVGVIFLTKLAANKGYDESLELTRVFASLHLIQASWVLSVGFSDIFYNSSYSLGVLAGIYFATVLYNIYDWSGFSEYLERKGTFELGFVDMLRQIAYRFNTMALAYFKADFGTELYNFKKFVTGKLVPSKTPRNFKLSRVLVYRRVELLCGLLATAALVGMILL